MPSRGDYFVHTLLRARDWQHRPQLDAVCDWWRGGGQGVCALIGIGGAGKTAIADRFLQVVPGVLPLDAKTPKVQSLPTPNSVFVFSFYDAPNPEAFFDELHNWLRLTVPTYTVAQVSPSGRVSYHQVVHWLQGAPPGLLILDGMEKIQEDGTRGGIFGRIADGNLRDFLTRLAQGWLPHLSALVTSRFPLADLDEATPTWYRPIDVEEIQLQTGIDLLRGRGVTGGDDQLAAIVENCGRHALTVDMAGGLLCEFHQGDPTTNLAIGTAEEIEQAASREQDPRRRAVLKQELRFAKVAGRYREALAKRDKAALALLERVCLFRLGVDANTLASIFTGKGSQKAAGPALSRLGQQRLQEKLDLLVRMGLLERSESSSSLSTLDSRPLTLFTIHPAVRDGFLSGLDADTRQQGHEAAREGLTAALGESPGENPSDPATLDLLEEIVHHTLQSGHIREAWDIYQNRIGGYRNLGWRLGAYERGERICRAFAGGQSPETIRPLSLEGEGRGEGEERSGGFQPPSQSGNDQRAATGSHRYKDLPENDQAIFINAWALYLQNLGRLAAAAGCYEVVIEMLMRQEKWKHASTGNQNLCEVWLLSGRLTGQPGAFRRAEVALRLAELADDPHVRMNSYRDLGAVRARCGNVVDALCDFRTCLEWQEKSGEYPTSETLFALKGVQHSLLLTYLDRHTQARQSTDANKDAAARYLGENDVVTPKCNLVLSVLDIEFGDVSSANHRWTQARDWALARDAKEVLCWSCLVEAEKELSAISGQQSAKEEQKKHLAAAHTALESGLKIARDCGFGLYHIDLLLVRARLHLLRGDTRAALDDIEVALGDEAGGGGIPANEETGQPELLAANHKACGYAWAIPAALQLRAEALLLQAAQQLGSDSYVPAKINELPTDVANSMAQAKDLLHEALDLWQPLHDPEPERDDQNFKLNGKEYNYRAADTHQVLVQLEGGVLTRYPLRPMPQADEPEPSTSQAAETSDSKEASDMTTSHKYDALISYRRQEPDKGFARDLLKKLEADGYKVAIDERDFDPSQTFVEEMERCIKESRFTLAVMSPRYLESGNCAEEAIICKVLDMGERKRRIIPLVIEQVTMPTWLYNIVGVNFTDTDPIVDPYERTKHALGNPQ